MHDMGTEDRLHSAELGDPRGQALPLAEAVVCVACVWPGEAPGLPQVRFLACYCACQLTAKEVTLCRGACH